MNCGLIVVLFNPDIAHVQGIIDGFADPQWRIYLVDNSPIAHQFNLPAQAEYLHFPNNEGIAKAQNEGLKRAFDCVDYAFLLDQDSHFSADMAAKLLSQFVSLERANPVAAIGPSIHCEFSRKKVEGKLQKGKQITKDLKEVKQIIASGMLLSQQAFHEVGEKESDLFIDGVDHEWCWRAKERGWRVYQSLSVCMPHRQGDDRVRIAGVTFKKGAPIRLYYQMRNLLVLSRRPYVPLYWKFRHLTAIPLRYLVNRYCFENGKRRGQLMRKGLYDGIRTKKGKVVSP